MDFNNNISFDFDGTLDTKAGNLYVLDLMKRGFNVWIVTSRSAMNITNMREVIDFADGIGISRQNIIFTSGKDKSSFFRNNDFFLFHLDDDSIEVNEINELNLKTKAISFFGNTEWREQCENILLNGQVISHNE